METALPADGDESSEMLELAQYPSMLSVASVNLSSSMSSLTLASPTEKGKLFDALDSSLLLSSLSYVNIRYCTARHDSPNAIL